MFKKLTTINFHLTDICNYKCKFCFINKENKELSFDNAIIIINKIKQYFDHYHLKGRINLVGGEPLCYKRIQDIIDYIKSLNIDVSIVTNGYLLTNEFIINNKDKLSMIGISVDSIDNNTNKLIGRCCGCKSIEKNHLLEICNTIKKCNINLKINTCVMKTNLNEDLSSLIKEIKPDRYKIFQVVLDTKFAKENAITNDEFNKYLSKYNGIDYFSETNDYMLQNYLIVDSRGFLCNNNRHQDVINLLENNNIYDYVE